MELVTKIGKSIFFPLYGAVEAVGGTTLANQLSDIVLQECGPTIAEFSSAYFEQACPDELKSIFEQYSIDELFSIDSSPCLVVFNDSEEEAIHNLTMGNPSIGKYVQDNIGCPDITFPDENYPIARADEALKASDYIAKLLVYTDEGSGVIIISKK